MRPLPAPDGSHPPDVEIRIDPWQLTAARLRVSMAVMLGRSQLLQRQILNGQVWDATACLETLATIDDAIRHMEAELREVEAEQP
jgi:hypothetical protein